MEDNQEQGARISLRDISQALSNATREEMAEFATTLRPLLLDPLYDVAVWRSLSFDQQKERIEKTPWVWDMLSQWEKMAYERENKQHDELCQCIVAIHRSRLEKSSGAQKAPWWMFWK